MNCTRNCIFSTTNFYSQMNKNNMDHGFTTRKHWFVLHMKLIVCVCVWNWEFKTQFNVVLLQWWLYIHLMLILFQEHERFTLAYLFVWTKKKEKSHSSWDPKKWIFRTHCLSRYSYVVYVPPFVQVCPCGVPVAQMHIYDFSMKFLNC